MYLLIEFFLFGSFIILIYTYLIYPLIIKIISKFYASDEQRITNQLFSVSIIISAYNEEKVLKQRIENIAKLNYDFRNIEVLVGSDCSNDKTNEILDSLKGKYPWLTVFKFNKRRGKASVLNDLVKESKNEILLFTDANTNFDRDILKYILPHFNNPKIGGVSGRLILTEPEKNFNKSIEEKKYWNYETKIKLNEGRCGILIGANGGIYSVRKCLFENIPIEKAVTDDLFITLSILKQNYKFIYEFNAIASEEVAHELLHEFRRKVRFASTNFQTIVYTKELFFNKNILIPFTIWSHKIFRWLSPILFIIILISNFALYNKAKFFEFLFYSQVIFYFLSFSGFVLNYTKIKNKVFTIPFYFVMTNVALVIGLIKFIRNKHEAYWQSTPRE